MHDYLVMDHDKQWFMDWCTTKYFKLKSGGTNRDGWDSESTFDHKCSFCCSKGNYDISFQSLPIFSWKIRLD